VSIPFEKSIICPVLIGRDAPRDTLIRLALDKGRIALISGEAGIGKSRLIREVKARLPDRRVLEGHCFEPDRTLPYAPLVEALRAVPGNQLADHLREAAPEIAYLLPELASHFPRSSPIMDTDQQKRRLHQSLVDLIVHIAQDRPLVLIIEDIHWCDEASLEFLAFMTRHLESLPIVLILTYRSDEIRPGPAHFLAGLDRQRLAVEFNLSRLARGEVDKMFGAIFDLPPGRQPDFLESIYDLTEGNPFFVEEVLKSLVASSDVFYSQGRWECKPLRELRIPRSVQVAVQRRTEGLTPEARELLILAAVAGRQFDFKLLHHLTSYPETTLIEQIKQLMTAQLVVEESADTFAFRHALTRQAVYSGLLARERRALHRALAEAIEQVYAQDEARLGDLSHHYNQAEIWDKAAAFALRAGEKAQKLYSPRAATEYYTRAIEAMMRQGAKPAASIYHARAQMAELTGDLDAARTDYELALTTARETGDTMAEWQNLLALGFFWTGRDFERAGGYLQQAIALARAIGDLPTLAHSLNRVGNWYANQEQPLEALRCHQEALEIFQQLDDPRGLAATLDLLGISSVIAGNMNSSADYYAQAIQRFRDLGDRMGLVYSLVQNTLRGSSYMAEVLPCPPASLNMCRREGEEALQIAQEIGWQSGEAGVGMYLGLMLGARGDCGRALELGRRALDIATRIEHRLWITATHMLLGRLHFDLLDYAGAEYHLQTGLTWAKESRSVYLIKAISAFLALTYTALGKLTEAETLLQMAQPGEIVGTPTLVESLLWWACAELALAQGEPEAALDILDQLIESGQQRGTNQATAPRLLYTQGIALANLHRGKAAASTFQAALAAATAQELLPLIWRIYLGLGKLHQANARRDQAEDAFDAARRIIEQLADRMGSEGPSFQKRALDLIPSLPALTPRQTAKRAYSGLTEREREIAILIAEGQSSREIAKKLVLSKRTVDAHIGNILAKLGFSSRAQIARWAAEKGLV
jgi:DNA-binding CsgD family transcriptional regulator